MFLLNKDLGIKILFSTFLILLPAISFSAELNSIQLPGVGGTPRTNQGVITMTGKPGVGGKVTLSNSTATLRTLITNAGYHWLQGSDNNLIPIGGVVQAETYAARCMPGVTSPTVDNVGFVLDVGQSWELRNIYDLDSLRCVNKTSGSNAVLQFLLRY